MIVLVDSRMDDECLSALASRGFEVISLPKFDMLQTPVSAHPDMLLFVGGGMLLCHEKYYEAARDVIDHVVSRTGLSLTLSDEEWGRDYPSDVLFNAAPIGECIIANKKSVSRIIREAYGEERLINTRQGYTKCSVSTVGDDAIITADQSVARAAGERGIDVLLLDGSHTRLDGYNEGFIGGASGDDGEHIFFCGDLLLHPEADRIREFCERHGRVAVSLSREPLYDYGSLIFI